MENYRYYLREKYEFTHGTWFAIGLAVWVIGGVLGFLYELIFYWANNGFNTFYMRGSTFGPWIDVYCITSLLIVLILYKLRRQPWFVFLIAAVGCSVVQFGIGYALYYLFGGIRLWNYNLEILNYGSLGGFVCLRSAIVFGVLALLMIYVFVPLVFHMACSIRPGAFIAIWVIIGFICLADIVYNDFIVALVPGFTGATEIYKELGLKYMTR